MIVLEKGKISTLQMELMIIPTMFRKNLAYVQCHL